MEPHGSSPQPLIADTSSVGDVDTEPPQSAIPRAIKIEGAVDQLKLSQSPVHVHTPTAATAGAGAGRVKRQSINTIHFIVSMVSQTMY